MTMDVRTRDWQRRFDETFPNGVMVMPYLEDEEVGTEDGPTPNPNQLFIPYRARNVTVTKMETPFSPTIRFVHYPHYGTMTKDMTLTVDTFTVEQEEPCPIVRVTDTEGGIWRFSGCLSEKAIQDSKLEP
jgi:hypothetical protein